MQRVAVTFEDVAVHFCPEEWALLSRWQRELYWEVMMDNYDLVNGLDSLDIKPPLVCGMEPGQTSRGTAEPTGSALWDEDAAGDVEPGRPTPRPTWGGWGRAGAAGICGAHRVGHEDPTRHHECTACGKVFRHRRNLLAHKKQRGHRGHRCAECGHRFCLRGDLLRHRHRRDPRAPGEGTAATAPRPHRGSARLLGDRRPFSCGCCGRRFSWRESLQLHLHGHAGERPHAGQRPHVCTLCHKSFGTAAGLTAHRRRHRHIAAGIRTRSGVRRGQHGQGDGGEGGGQP